MRMATYEERLQELERRNEEISWSNNYDKAVDKHDYSEIEELLKEAFAEEYDIPLTSDSKILSIIERLKKV